MKKNPTENDRQHTGSARVILLACAVLLLLAAVVSLLIVKYNSKENINSASEDGTGDNAVQDLQPHNQQSEEAIQTDGNGGAAEVDSDTQNTDTADSSVELISGVIAEKLVSVNQDYLENGREDAANGTAAVKIKNLTGNTLEALSFKMVADGKEYSFSVSMLPGGKSLVAVNLEGYQMPKETQNAEYQVDYHLFCRTEPRLYEKKYDIDVCDGMINVTNLTDKEADDQIVIYYKNVKNGCYYPGSTYRIRIKDGISAGGSVSVTAEHAVKGQTEIISVEEIENE